jgi:NAD(P)-dependent dehydrogenase (short-subunit alcohol dehydrogenase family)
MVASEGLPISVSVMDVDSDDSVAQAIDKIRQQSGGIDVLVNNAGVLKSGAIEQIPFSDFRHSMETNYFGPLWCIQAVVGEMRERRGGSNLEEVGRALLHGARPVTLTVPGWTKMEIPT